MDEILEDERGFSTSLYDPETAAYVERYHELARVSEPNANQEAELSKLFSIVNDRVGAFP